MLVSPTRLCRSPPLKIIDEEEELLSETKEIVQLCGENNAILGTGHITPEEIYLLAKYCKAVHFDKLVVTHPLFLTPNLSVEQIGELHELGVYFEFCSTEVCPIPGGETSRIMPVLLTDLESIVCCWLRTEVITE